MNKLLFLAVNALAPASPSDIVQNLFNEFWRIVKEIGTPLASATVVCSAFYFFIIGSDKNRLDKAKSLMIGAFAALLIIYFGPTIVNYVVDALSNGSVTTP